MRNVLALQVSASNEAKAGKNLPAGIGEIATRPVRRASGSTPEGRYMRHEKGPELDRVEWQLRRTQGK